MTEHRTRDWQGLRAIDPPAMRHEFADLLRMAEGMLASRQDRFPAQVAAGEISAEFSAAQIAACTDLVADWRFIASGGAEGEPASPASLFQRRQLLDESLRTIAALADRSGGFTDTLARQGECVIALRWHLEPGRDQVALSRLTHQLRTEAQEERENAKCA